MQKLVSFHSGDLNMLVRKIIFERDGYRCKKCGSKSKLVVHHRKYPAESFDDLATYCQTCNLKEKIRIRRHRRIKTTQKTIPIMLSLSDDLAEQINKRVKRGGYISRQELIKEVIRGAFPKKVGENK